ncbi:MAG: urate hydroxylase PuuD [Candidatus Eremiobacteraeota bacterium]|nr:urate hydroxylase PuuD [Candidatus Eremiobacteraeota bacterium]
MLNPLFNPIQWITLFLWWFHVIAGFTWLGQTYLFNRLEKWMAEFPPKEGGNVAGSLWMVHGGGFYHLQKQKKPQIMPEKLHSFKWQSGLTWISGFLLLLLLFYYEKNLVMGNSSFETGLLIGLGVILLSWPIYTLIWRSPLGKNEPIGVLFSFLLILAISYGLSRVMTGWAFYLHIGAMFGTIMAANVWLTIIPSQKHLVEAVESGKEPDMTLAARAKQASKHNTYLSFPLVLTMISSHFSWITYGTQYSWEILGGIIIIGWIAAKIVRG